MASLGQNKDNNKHQTILFLFFIIVGVLLAIIQYLLNRSLWIDEAMLSLNIISRDFLGLLKPLDLNQVAPIGYLFIIKLIALPFNYSEYGLRLFSLLCFLGSIPLIFLVSKLLTKSKVAAYLSAALLSLNYWMISYATMAKQYMADVFIALLLYVITLKINFSKTFHLVILAIVGSLAIFLSNISFIILFTCGVYIFISQVIKRKNYSVLFIFVAWLTTAFFYYFLFIYNHPSAGALKLFHNNSFLPLNPFSLDFWIFISLKTIEIFGSLLITYYSWWILPFFIYCATIAFLIYKKRGKLLLFVSLPVCTHIVLSGLRLYPFKDRLILYLVPFFIIVISFGVVVLTRFVQKKSKLLSTIILFIPIVVIIIPLYNNFPLKMEEIKASIDYLDKQALPGDKIYVYYGANSAYQYYRKIEYIKNNNPTIWGTSHRQNPEDYMPELLKLDGRVWLIFSHVYPFYNKTNNEETYIIKQIKKHNYSLLDYKKHYGSSIYLINIE